MIIKKYNRYFGIGKSNKTECKASEISGSGSGSSNATSNSDSNTAGTSSTTSSPVG
jgi:hypothetical protein